MAINRRRANTNLWPNLWNDWTLDDQGRSVAAPSFSSGPRDDLAVGGKLHDDWSVERGGTPIDEVPTKYAQLGKAGNGLVERSREIPRSVGPKRFRPPIDRTGALAYFAEMDRDEANLQIDEVARWLQDPSEDPRQPEKWSRSQVGFAVSRLTKPTREQFDLDKAEGEARKAADDYKYIWQWPDRREWFKKKYLGTREWDIKKYGKPYEDYGNVMYGYLGRTADISSDILRFAAGLVQEYSEKNRISTPERLRRTILGGTQGDDAEDYGFVTLGIRAAQEKIPVR